MRVAGHRFIQQWPPFESDGIELAAEVHTVKADKGGDYGQRRSLFLTDPRNPKRVEWRPREVTKIAYRAYENEGRALFIGMTVSHSMRRQGLGRRIFDYFVQNVGEEDGLDFAGTGKMHKPVIALIVARAGLTPKSHGCIAEVLPRRLAEDPDVPLIRFLREDIPPHDMKDMSARERFYELAPPGAVTDRAINPDRVVVMHTGYAPDTQPLYVPAAFEELGSS
jgi:hypothetical protein